MSRRLSAEDIEYLRRMHGWVSSGDIQKLIAHIDALTTDLNDAKRDCDHWASDYEEMRMRVVNLQKQVAAADALADAAELREQEQYSTGEYPIASVRRAFRNAIDTYRATQPGATEGGGE